MNASDGLMSPSGGAQPPRLVASVALSLAGLGLGVVQVWLLMQWIGLTGDWLASLTIEAFAVLVGFVGFAVPGSLGVQEGGKVLIFAALGLPLSAGLSVGVAFRVNNLANQLLGFVVLAWLRPQRALRQAPGATPAAPEQALPDTDTSEEATTDHDADRENRPSAPHAAAPVAAAIICAPARAGDLVFGRPLLERLVRTCHRAQVQRVFVEAADGQRAEVRVALGGYRDTSDVSVVGSLAEVLEQLPADAPCIVLRGNLVLGAAQVRSVMASQATRPGEVVALQSTDPAHRGSVAAGRSAARTADC